MSEKRESDEFEDDDADEAVEGDDADLDHLLKDLERQKRRGAPKGGEPAWRRLEKYMEQKRTAELLSDFDDYEIGEGEIDVVGDDDSDADPSSDDADEPGEDSPRGAGRGRRRAR